MILQPITDDCDQILQQKHHVCFGISPFNSYFSQARIEQLARWGQQEFQSMHFFVPDIPSIYTLEALGYEPEKAAWKARRQNQYLQNKIQKALLNIGFESEASATMIVNWAYLSRNESFQKLSADVITLFETSTSFKESCIEASSWVLEGRLPPGAAITHEQTLHAVKYLLSEIPLFLDSAGILGADSSVFCYHQCIPFIENLIRGVFDCKRNKTQGFVVIKSHEQNTNTQVAISSIRVSETASSVMPDWDDLPPNY